MQGYLSLWKSIQDVTSGIILLSETRVHCVMCLFMLASFSSFKL